MTKVDLHMHSTWSDGDMTPEELLNEALKRNISIMAVTDHDEVSAYAELTNRLSDSRLKVISGMEFNTYEMGRELHILAYHMDVEHPLLKQYLDWRKQERLHWANEIIKKLSRHQFSLSLEEVLSCAQGGVVNRIHIAKILVEKHYFNDVQEAFTSVLARGKIGFVDRQTFTPKQAIELIHACGGMAVLAHPGIYSFEWELRPLVQADLDGMEVYYALHDQAVTNYWFQQADRYGLYMTVGSDFHGFQSKNSTPIGSVEYDESQLERFLQQLFA